MTDHEVARTPELPPPELSTGRPSPLGATLDAHGVNFAVRAAAADAVELCLIDHAGHESRVPLPARTGSCWHGYVPGIRAGQRYGYRVSGEWAPERGRRANPAKLLLDPYARAVDGTIRWDDALFDQVRAPTTRRPASPDPRDSGPFMPAALVIDPTFDWGDDRPPAIPWQDTVIYEAHVKGLTMLHPDVPEAIRGTYAAVGHPAIVEHLRTVGVTSLELLPVHQFVDDRRLVDAGLTNYWGYNTIGFLAPHNAYASGGNGVAAVHEFKSMVKQLHASGIEVILDVVYNHTAEGGRDAETLAFRGFDEAGYYRFDPDDPSRYLDTTGTGNALDASREQVRRLILDSLRHWVDEMHVDGFRFDLAASLARHPGRFDPEAPIFELIHQDPTLRTVKLIAEPWDVGPGGYQLGSFPPRWSEWNDRFRDTLRDLWRSTPVPLGEVADRLAASPSIFPTPDRPARASINFVTCHDGFTLVDLVSYERKHNEANGEDNQDGADENRSSNGGVEGPTADPDILEARARRIRAMLAMTLLADGTPMLLGGDEIGRTQSGNNNAYCLDDRRSWLDWDATDPERIAFVHRLVDLRASVGMSARAPRTSTHARGGSDRDLGSSWYRLDGSRCPDTELATPAAPGFWWRRSRPGCDAGDPAIETLVGVNVTDVPHAGTFPPSDDVQSWVAQVDTSTPDGSTTDEGTYRAGDRYAFGPLTVVVFVTGDATS